MAATRPVLAILAPAFAAMSVLALLIPAAGAADASEKEVRLQNIAFDPKELTITVGDTVKWINMDSTGHDVTFEDGERSGEKGGLQSGDTWNRTFTKEGTYRYRCAAHSVDFGGGMVGKIIVKKESSGGGPPPPSISLGPLPPGTMAALGIGALSILVSVIALISPLREKSPYKEVDAEAVKVEVSRPKKE